MKITFRSVRQWPEDTPERAAIHAPFKRKVNLVGELRTELQRFRAANVRVSGYWKLGSFTRDGQLYADARAEKPGVILEFERGSTKYRLFTRRFGTWQDNLYALTKILEDMRRMERYGVSTGQLLEGFRALPGSTAAEVAMTREDAAMLLADQDETIAAAILHDPRLVDVYARVLRDRHHPDKGGDSEQFVLVGLAVDALTKGGA